LHAEQILSGTLVAVATDELNAQAALRAGGRQEQVSLNLLKLDPNNVVSLNNLAVAEFQLGDSLWAAGRVHEAIPHFVKQVDAQKRASAGGASVFVSYFGASVAAAYHQAAVG